MPQKSFEDFELGQRFITARRTVTETDIVNFACLTGDFYPLHVDQVYAEATPFRTRIAHGPLTFALAVGLMSQTGFLGDSLVAFLGADALRFLGPVRSGDTVHVEANVTAHRPTSKGDKGITVLRYSVKNQCGEEVMSVDMSFLMWRRADGPP
jgi:acyl dehydratase